MIIDVLDKIGMDSRVELKSFINMCNNPITDHMAKNLKHDEVLELERFLDMITSKSSRHMLTNFSASGTSYDRSYGTRSEQREFEKLGLLESVMVRQEEGAYRMFKITDAGKKIVNTYLQKDTERIETKC